MTDSCALQRRPVDSLRALSWLTSTPGLTELEAQLFAARGADPSPSSLPALLNTPLVDLVRGADRVYEAIQHRQRIVVVADYDCDGATSCATAVAGLSALGGCLGYIVPDRMVHGYGISPSIVDLARDRFPDVKVLVTVDNGVMGHAGISYAAGLGLDVVVTDHHLPGSALPAEAYAVIDPARADDHSGMEKLAGVAIALFLVSAVKKRMAAEGLNTPSLTFLLPYLAVGTVADMVSLDAHNRQLVATGIELMRQGKMSAGLSALVRESGLREAYLTTKDIGFSLGPRINAAGRLDSMETGIELLLCQDAPKARKLAKILTDTNDERRRLQKEATADATFELDLNFHPATRAIVTGKAEWHAGIVGLVASRLKDQFFRPTFVFSLADGKAKGSGRSIPGFHLKDALEEVARRCPNVLEKFGGHAMAAGATLTSPEALEPFGDALAMVARQRLNDEMLQNVIYSDGPMPDMTLHSAARVMRHPWGQHFEAPAFDDDAVIDAVKPLGKTGQHWSIQARVAGREERTSIVLFNHDEPVVGQEVHVYLQPGLNTWLDKTSLQWMGRILP